MARPESNLQAVIDSYYRGRGLFGAHDIFVLLVRIEALEAAIEEREKKSIPRPEERENTT